MSGEHKQALKQSKANALNALLCSSTITEAAEKAGISRKTLYTYMREDADFAAAYKAAQDCLTLERMDAIEADRRQAISTIKALMQDKTQPGIVRLKAAQTILDAVITVQNRAEEIANSNVKANINPLEMLVFSGKN